MNRGIISILAVIIIMTIAIPSSASQGKSKARRNPQLDAMLDVVNDWTSFAEEWNLDVIDYGTYAIQDHVYSVDFDLAPGFYNVWSQLDDRFDASQLTITAFDEDGNPIGQAMGDLNAYVPFCEFILRDPQRVHVEFAVSDIDESDTPCLAWMLTFPGGIDDESRHEYIERMLSDLIDGAEGDGATIIASDTLQLSSEEPSVYLNFHLPEGEYAFDATGGYLIQNLNIAVYDRRARSIGEDNTNDNFPVVVFDVDREQDITIEISSDGFREGFDGDYFCICLSTMDDYEGAVG